MSDAATTQAARQVLIAELREHALVIGEVTLTSGETAQYYVDAKRAILLRPAFVALGELVAGLAGRARRHRRRRHDDGRRSRRLRRARPPAPTRRPSSSARRSKEHGLQRWVEGPLLEPGERCLIVEDVVTTGGSTVQAIERVREEGLEIVGVCSVLDRLAGGGEAIEAAARAPYTPLRHDRRRLPGPARRITAIRRRMPRLRVSGASRVFRSSPDLRRRAAGFRSRRGGHAQEALLLRAVPHAQLLLQHEHQRAPHPHGKLLDARDMRGRPVDRHSECAPLGENFEPYAPLPSSRRSSRRLSTRRMATRSRWARSP